MSISSGVLCKFTAYIGVREKTQIEKTIDNLRDKSKQDEERAKKELNKAIAFKKAGNTKNALGCLRKKVILDSNIENVNKMINNLEYQQKLMKDPSFMSKQSQVLALSNQLMKESNLPNADEIGDVYDEVGQGLDEITESFSQFTDNLDAVDNNDGELLKLYDDLDVSKAEDDEKDNNNDDINELMAAFDTDKKVDKNKTAVDTKNHNDNEINELMAGDDSDKKFVKSETPKSKNSNKPVVAEKSNDNFKFMSITQLQKIEGFWEDLNALNKILGTKINSINGVKLSEKITEKNCVATILAIAALRVKAPSKKNSWMMIEQKAINWLKKKLNGFNIEQIIAETQKLI